MPDAVRQECSIFSTIALALLFISQVLGVYMTHALRLPLPQVALLGAVFYATMLICATFLPLLSVPLPGKSKGGGLLLLLAFCAALLFVGHGMGGIFAIALRSAGVGLLWVVALHAFFLFAPQHRKGLLLGLSAASGELIWVALLPAVNNFFSDSTSPVNHLLMLNMALQFGSLFLLAAAFAFRLSQAGNAQPNAFHANGRSEEASGLFVLPMLFFAAAVMYILYAQATGLAFLRVGHSGIPDSAHILLLFTMPLVGALFDRGGRGCCLLLTVFAILAFAAPLMLSTAQKGIAREALYALLCVGRQGFFLYTLLLADRLLQNRKRLPLLLALACILPLTAITGRAIARLDIDIAIEMGFAVVLALAFAYLALRLRSALSGLPTAGDEVGASVSLDLPHLAAFASTHGLSKQETSVMEMLAQGRSTENIAKAMNVAEGTVRKYVSRILHKTNAHNRAALITLFAAPNRISAQKMKPDTPIFR
jgi:DNA-binding CsgD family transcriptional regulator